MYTLIRGDCSWVVAWTAAVCSYIENISKLPSHESVSRSKFTQRKLYIGVHVVNKGK